MRKNYDRDPKKRDLQKEAEAHIAVQRWIDGGALAGRSTTFNAIREIHQRFCEALPDDLLWVQVPGTRERVRVAPGELRQSFVEVGNHLAISPGAVPRFMREFELLKAWKGQHDS
jgi:hypothetical protein